MTEKGTQRTLLLSVLNAVHFVHARSEIGRIAAEGNFKRGEETVHTRQQRLWSTGRKENIYI
jgi:hypothetical protein